MAPSCYFIATSWKNSVGSHHFRALAGALGERGHRTVLLVDGRRCDVESRSARRAVFTWPSPRPVKARDARFLWDLVHAYRPACLIANFGAGNVMMLVGRMMAVPCRVIWYRTLSSAIQLDGGLARWKLALLRLRKRLVYRTATHLVANSDAAREDLHRRYGVPLTRSRTFYNSLADPLSGGGIAGAATPERGRFVCIGRLYPTKGQDVLIRALALLKDRWPEARVEFVGDGPARPACMRLAEEIDVADRCGFIDAVPHGEVLARMASAFATVVPSRSEAFGSVNIESLAVGTPVVASGVGGIGEIVRDGVDGFLVPPEDPAALAAKLEVLLQHPELVCAMRENARARFLSRFEQRTVVAEQADWLEAIVTARVAPAAPANAWRAGFAGGAG